MIFFVPTEPYQDLSDLTQRVTSPSLQIITCIIKKKGKKRVQVSVWLEILMKTPHELKRCSRINRSRLEIKNVQFSFDFSEALHTLYVPRFLSNLINLPILFVIKKESDTEEHQSSNVINCKDKATWTSKLTIATPHMQEMQTKYSSLILLSLLLFCSCSSFLF